MDRRQIDDVKTQRRDVPQVLGRLAKRGAALRVGAPRAGKHLVPRAEPRPLAVDDDREHPVIDGSQAAVCVLHHQLEQAVVERRVDADRLVGIAAEQPGLFLQLFAVACRGWFVPFASCGGLCDERGAFHELGGHVQPGSGLDRHLVAPRQEGIHPGLDRVLVAPHLVDTKTRPPHVVGDELHRRLRPRARASFTAPPVSKDRRQHVVPISMHVRRDLDGLARGALYREPTGVDLRLHALDHHAAEAIRRYRRWRTGATSPRRGRRLTGVAGRFSGHGFLLQGRLWRRPGLRSVRRD